MFNFSCSIWCYVEPSTRFELVTPSLPRTCSTPELRGPAFCSFHFADSRIDNDELRNTPLRRRSFFSILNSSFSIRAKARWSGRRGSNPRPTAWKAVTLPTELLPRLPQSGGEWRIRTSVGRGPADLQSAAFDRSANSPRVELSSFFGAGDGTRTRDLLITNQLLYQLSYASANSDNVLISKTQPASDDSCVMSCYGAAEELRVIAECRTPRNRELFRIRTVHDVFVTVASAG